MALTIRKNIVSKSIASKVTSSGVNKRDYIVVHETDNTRKGADANAHGRLQASGNSRQASWHYTVDDKEAVQSFDDTAICWHAGSGKYNREGIGVEICVNSDGDYRKAVANAAELVRHLQRKHNIPTSSVVQHNTASGKNCPRYLRNGAKGVTWGQFKTMLSGNTATKPKPSTPVKSTNTGKSISRMADEVIAGKHGSGHANRRISLGVDASTYAKVRAEVNRRAGVKSSKPTSKPSKTVSQMATEVIAGKHGSGHANRRKSLGVSQATYDKVRAEVNRRSGVSTAKPIAKSIGQMAQEVIDGKHGRGHANRRKSLGISQAQYNKVRAEVNKRLR